MSSCTDCTTAATRTWGAFTHGCLGCCARAAARSPQYSKARDLPSPDTRRAYRALLQQFGLTHDQVREAAKADFEMQGPKP